MVPLVPPSGQVWSTVTGIASMAVATQTLVAPMIVTLISVVRQMVSAMRLPVGCAVGIWFRQMKVWWPPSCTGQALYMLCRNEPHILAVYTLRTAKSR